MFSLDMQEMNYLNGFLSNLYKALFSLFFHSKHYNRNYFANLGISCPGRL